MVKTISICYFIIFHNYCSYYSKLLFNLRCQNLRFIEIFMNKEFVLGVYRINQSINPEAVYTLIIEEVLFC